MERIELENKVSGALVRAGFVAITKSRVKALCDDLEVVTPQETLKDKANSKIEGIRDFYRQIHGTENNYKIPAIKIVREITGLGLKESKYIVDTW